MPRNTRRFWSKGPQRSGPGWRACSTQRFDQQFHHALTTHQIANSESIQGAQVQHESRLTIALGSLLQSQRVAAMGTIGDDGAPYVSMVPYALAPSVGCLVIHVSGLAVHTRNLQARPSVSLLVVQFDVPGASVHALPRVTLAAIARWLTPNSRGPGRLPRQLFGEIS